MLSPKVSNLVLVTVDSLRADALGAYGGEWTTPVMDSLAESGTVFERAFAAGNWTPFSFPSILASRPVFADSPRIGVDGAPTLASALSDAGLSTAGFNAANGFLTSHWGYDDGFDEFEPFVAGVGSGLYRRYLATHPTVEAWIQLATSPVRRLSARIQGGADDQPFLDTSRMFAVEHAATSFIEETTSPFFLWVHYMDAHTPYVPAPRYIREVSEDLLGTHRMLNAHARTGLGWDVGERALADLRTLYQAATYQIDASIGRLLEALAAAGVKDTTAVVLAGDHGEEFQEHGHLAHYPKLYDELIRVPLVVDVPGAESRRIGRQVGLGAIPPTVADLLGVESPPEWVGETLAPSVVHGDPPSDEPVVSVAVRGEEVTAQPIPRSPDHGDLLVSVRDREWTYVENVDTGDVELYHRPTDPAEQDDLSADRSEDRQPVIEQFGSRVDEHVATLQTRDGRPADGPVDDDDVEARLSALGYR